MSATRHASQDKDFHSANIEILLRDRLPNRNEKYYQILLNSRDYLLQTSFRLNLTSDAIIKQCETARPTWYLYFRGVNQYYKETISVMGQTMIDYALGYLPKEVTYQNWASVARSLKMLVYLSNSKTLCGYFPELGELWQDQYQQTVEGYANILSPILKLSPARTHLFVKTIANEIIVHKEKYFADLDLFDQFVNREYALFLSEQNN